MAEDIVIRIPNAQPYVLSKLYQIRESLRSTDVRAALLHCNDCLVRVQNELDWSYGTDMILPFIREFLLELDQNLRTNTTKVYRDVLSIVNSTIDEVTQATSSMPAWNEPDAHLDLLEIEHRTQLYGDLRQ